MAKIRVLNSVGATVTIDGVERESVTVDAGTTVHWKVSKEGYVTQEGDYTVWEDTLLPVVLKREEDTITFNVSPTDATLKVNGSAVALTDGKYTMTAKWGDTVYWSCGAVGYIVQNGNFTATGDRTVDITLEEEVVVLPDRTITFIVEPTHSKLVINGTTYQQDADTGVLEYIAHDGDVLEWEASYDGFVPQSGSHTVNGDATVTIKLEEEVVVEPSIWFERDGKVIDTINLDCSGDRIEVDVRTSRDDVMWKIDADQLSDWDGTSIYIRNSSGTGPGKVTIYREMNDASELGAWSVGVMFHWGLTSSYELGTETLTVNRLECEANHLYWGTRRMTFNYGDHDEQTAKLYSNLQWGISVTGDTSNALRLTATSGSGDEEVGVTPSSFSDETSYDYTVKATSSDGGYSDSLYVHLRSLKEQGEGISFLDGMEFKVDDQTEGNYSAEHEISFRIRTWGGVTRMRLDGGKRWMADLGGEWGLSSVECNGQTLTADGEFSLEAETEYTVNVRWHNWYCRDTSELGTPYGIELELNFDSHNPDGVWDHNEVRIYTTNGETGPYSTNSISDTQPSGDEETYSDDGGNGNGEELELYGE
ncbi:MAG: hypothetical protein LUD72_12945 [Bacteroidales bacterium]|nr:hypothetical protein [Bacteroidales bacterium]